MTREELNRLTGRNYEALQANEVYRQWRASSNATMRNGIRDAVNRKELTYREKLEEGAQAYFDYLWKEANLYQEYGGVRPVFEMEELEW